MPLPHVFIYPLPLPGEEWTECDHCKSDTLISETETHNGECLCLDCQDELTAPDPS